MAQSVPSATRIPCVRSLPLGWSLSVSSVVRGRATIDLLVTGGEPGGGPFGVRLGNAGSSATVEVTLTPTCPASGDDPTVRLIDVDGGCVTYRSSLPAGAEQVPSFDAGGGLSFVERSDLVGLVDREEDLRLCGIGAPCA